MALKRLKKLIEDLEQNTSLEVGDVTKTVAKATSAGNSGSSSYATTAGNSGTSLVAHYASSGTGAFAGTHAIYSTGL